jgi:4-amino-4-deoxy-L-arabinose transferase-like glycosyltransferase
MVFLVPPPDPAIAAVGHDSSYILLVAQNLLAGRGFVNDAHWLVFLKPESLPIPFHNANPLYPTIIAGISFLSGLHPIRSGLLVSALSNTLLFGGLLTLSGIYTNSRMWRLAIAVGGSAFPAVFVTSFDLLPDALWAAISVWLGASLFRMKGLSAGLICGALLGLAWLTRSSTLFLLPAIVVYVAWVRGVRGGLGQLLLMAGAAVLISLPWLVHQALVWGNPLRGDGSYYLLQDYFVDRDFSGKLSYYWHSLDEPAGLLHLLANEPLEFIGFVMRALPEYFQNVAAGWANSSIPAAVAIAILAAQALRYAVSWFSRVSNSDRGRVLPSLVAAFVYTATLFGVLAIRPFTIELRYLVLGSVILGVILMIGFLSAASDLMAARRVRPWISGTVATVGLAWWLAVVPIRDIGFACAASMEVTEKQEYFELARHMMRIYSPRGPVVVGDFPYYFTLATGHASLSIPYADGQDLLRYMDKYGAEFVLLTSEEVDFWLRDSGTTGDAPAGLEHVYVADDYVVYRLTK